jgi:hypothetical protein
MAAANWCERGGTKDIWQPRVQPDRMGGDLMWDLVAFVADGIGHARRSTLLALMPELT